MNMIELLIDYLKEANYEFSVIKNDIFVPIGNENNGVYDGVVAIRWDNNQLVYHIVAKYSNDKEHIYHYACDTVDEILELLQDEEM